MNEVVIDEAGRSAVGKRNGSLAGAHPADVLGPVMMEVLGRAGVDSSQVGLVVGGCINKVGAQAMNITRTAWLGHGSDEDIRVHDRIDAQCGSSQQAVNTAHALIASGVEDVVMACGVEAMSLLPIGSDAFAGAKAGLGKPVSRSYFEHYEFLSQFEGAERIAEKYEIDRSATDAFGLRSQELAATAVAEGRFRARSSRSPPSSTPRARRPMPPSSSRPMRSPGRRASRSWQPSNPSLARGRHPHGGFIVTDRRRRKCGSVDEGGQGRQSPRTARILARVKQTALVGCDPELMLEGPIPATRKILAAEGITVDDVDVFEINEAFASVVLAWAKELQPDMDRVNPNGGAIALGHPLGATGCFLTTKAVHELQRTGGRYAVVTMCCGGGLGTGTLIERI